MPHPLFHLARRLENRRRFRRTVEAGRKVQSDPHLARDVGLPYRPPTPIRTSDW